MIIWKEVNRFVGGMIMKKYFKHVLGLLLVLSIIFLGKQYFVSADIYSPSTYQDIEYYVNSNIGSDLNDGTKNKPFLTIGKALSNVPKTINHQVVIHIFKGIYSYPVVIEGFSGSGSLHILGHDYINTVTLPENHVIDNYISVRNNNVRIFVENLKINHHIDVSYNSQQIYINNCRIISTGLGGVGINFRSSNGEITNCTISNKYMAIKAEYCATVFSSNNDGVNNTYGLSATTTGTIGKH
jgi:hypothetical protein